MALQDARPMQRDERPLDECAADALSPERRSHDQMLKEAAPAIVTAEYGANDLFAFDSDETRARIPGEVALDGVPPIDVAENDALRGLPERRHSLIVGRGHFADFDWHWLLRRCWCRH